MIPTPRELSSDCGIVMRFDWGRAATVRTLLETAKVEIAAVHRME
jgi:hypothetical protein